MSRCDLDLGPAIPNIELVQDISYCTIYSNFMLLDRSKRFCKNATIIIIIRKAKLQVNLFPCGAEF